MNRTCPLDKRTSCVRYALRETVLKSPKGTGRTRFSYRASGCPLDKGGRQARLTAPPNHTAYTENHRAGGIDGGSR
jgi:hypothetical protein